MLHRPNTALHVRRPFQSQPMIPFAPPFTRHDPSAPTTSIPFAMELLDDADAMRQIRESHERAMAAYLQRVDEQITGELSSTPTGDQAMLLAVRQPMRLVLRVGQARVEYELDSYSVQTVPNVERADPRDPVAVVNVLEVEVNVRPGIEPGVRCTLSGQAHHLALAVLAGDDAAALALADLVRETHCGG